MPYVLSRERRPEHRRRVGRDPLTGQDRVPLKAPYGSSAPYYKNVTAQGGIFSRVPRRMRVTTGSKNQGISDDVEPSPQHPPGNVGQRRHDGAFFGPPDPAGSIVSAVIIPKVQKRPETPSRSNKQQMAVHGGRVIRAKPNDPKHAAKSTTAVEPRSLLRCHLCGTMPPASMTKRVHMIYGDVAFEYVRKTYDDLLGRDQEGVQAQSRSQPQPQPESQPQSQPQPQPPSQPQQRGRALQPTRSISGEPRLQFEAFSAMAREGRGRRQADIRIPGSQAEDEMVGVPTIGPAITYIVPSAAARVDGTQLVANLSPKVDLGSPVHGQYYDDTGAAMARIIQAKASNFFVVSDGVEQGPFKKSQFVPNQQTLRTPRPGKQGLWPKEEKIIIPSTNAGDFSAASADNIILARLEVDADAVLSAKQRVSVENLMTTDLVSQILPGVHAVASNVQSDVRPDSALGPPEVHSPIISSIPPDVAHPTEGESGDENDPELSADMYIPVATTVQAEEAAEGETSKLGDGVGDPDFQLLVNNEEPATFNQEEEEEEEGEDISESKDEVMHRPVITVRRGHQAVRKHSIDDYGEVGAQLMETESGRFRVAMEGDSIMQDGESVLDLDDVSIMSRSTIGEMISPMKEAPSKAPASAHQVPRPLTRELISPPIVTVSMSMDQSFTEIKRNKTNTPEPGQRPIPSTVIIRR